MRIGHLVEHDYARALGTFGRPNDIIYIGLFQGIHLRGDSLMDGAARQKALQRLARHHFGGGYAVGTGAGRRRYALTKRRIGLACQNDTVGLTAGIADCGEDRMDTVKPDASRPLGRTILRRLALWARALLRTFRAAEAGAWRSGAAGAMLAFHDSGT
jgi:hypothetical protein